MNTKARRILIVEDEPGHAEVIRRAFLAARPSDVVQVVGSLQACREALNVQVPDILISDIKLPDGRAFELLSSSDEERPYPVIVMTSYGNEQLVVEVMKAGAIDYVVKSSETLREMPRTVERVFREWNLLQQSKQTQAQLYIQQEELKAVYNGTTVMMCVIDKERNVLNSNQAFQSAMQSIPSDIKYHGPCVFMGCINAKDSPHGCGYGSECESCPLQIAMIDTLQTGTSHVDVECELLLQRSGEVSVVVLLCSVTPLPPMQGASRALVSLFDITDRRQAEDNRRFLSEGHKIAAQVSTELIKATSIADFDAAVNNTLGRLGIFFKVDRSYLVRFSDDCTRMSNTHEWCAPGVDSQMQHIQNQETDDLPWWKQQIMARMPMQINNVSELPPEAEAEKKEFMAQGICALICVPTIGTHGDLSGFIGFDTVRRVENWSEEKVAILQVIAGTIGSAYERLLSLGALKLSEMKVVSILNAIDDVVISTSMKDGTTYYVSPSYKKFFGKSMDIDSAGQHRWLEMLHPDDIEKFSNEFLAAIPSGSFIGEVRICKDDGEIRTMRVHSKLIFDDQGEPFRYDSYVSDITQMKHTQKKADEHLKELEQWHRVTLNREGRVQELKTEVNKLLTKHGEQPKYGKEE